MPRFAWPAALILVAGLAACQTADPGTETADRAVGDAETGRDTAVDWCGGCHVIGAGNAPEGEPPTFSEILELRSPDSIRHYLTWERHPAMPALALEQRDIEDLVAYFSYLQDR